MLMYGFCFTEYFDCVRYATAFFNIKMFTPYPHIMATSLLLPHSLVPKVAVVERFDCLCWYFLGVGLSKNDCWPIGPAQILFFFAPLLPMWV